MKKFYLSLICAVLCYSVTFAQSVSTFEDLNLPADSYWDGSDASAAFTTGDYTFINNFVDWGGGYTSWDGFAYSSKTATSYTSLADQYNSCVGHGVENSQTFGVAYYSSYNGTEPTVIEKNAAQFEAKGCYVTNSAYAYTSMLNGDAYAKKFDETDWFLLTATGYLNNVSTGTAEFYLAKDGNIVNDWQYFDLSALGTVDAIHFTLTSSDTGQWGMNTPAYFCIDNFGASNSAVGIKHVKSNTENNCYDMQGRRTNVKKGFTISNGSIRFTK